MADISKLSDAQLDDLIIRESVASGDLSKLTDQQLNKFIEQQKSKPTLGDDAITLGQKHASLGLAPVARGVGGYIGKAIGTLEGEEMKGDLQGGPSIKGWFERLGKAHEAGKAEFSKTRQEQIDAEADATARRPGLNAGIAGTTALLTAPLTAVRGGSAAARIGYGALSGGTQAALRAAGHANDMSEFTKDTATGALLGLGLSSVPEAYRAGKAAYGAIPEIGKEAIKKSVAGAVGFKAAGPVGAAVAAYFTPAAQELSEKAADLSAKSINADLWGTAGQAIKPVAEQVLRNEPRTLAQWVGGELAKGVSAKTPELAKGFMTYMANDIAGTSSAMDRRRQKLQGR